MTGKPYHLVPPNFSDSQFRVTKKKPCPICGKPDWCLSDWQTWALCKRIESGQRWKDAGSFHRLGKNGNGGRKELNERSMAKPATRPMQKSPEMQILAKVQVHKVWESLEEAGRVFGGLSKVIDDIGARNLLRNDYALALDWIPADWKVFDYPGLGPGVIYRGFTPSGSPVFKWRGLARSKKGKRKARFVFGEGGALIFRADPAVPWVVVAGEEKALIAYTCGYNALGSMTGEKALSDDWVSWLASANPIRIIMANDADVAGSEANQQTARKLEMSGFPCERIGVVTWPLDAPRGFDLNVVAKIGGMGDVHLLLEGASQVKPTLPTCRCAADFIVAPREPLQFHIANLLPFRGKLTFSATSKFGKSLWAIQVGFALAAGDCEWLGWRFGPPVRVLYLQAEIMDTLVEARLKDLLKTMPPTIDRHRAGRNFIVQEIDEGRPNLFEPSGRETVEALIRIHQPQVLILDPLTSLCPGLEENMSNAMGLALGYFSDLTVRFKCAVILIHHHGKGGGSRGSSAFEAWPESDLQASSNKQKTVARVDMRLRCAYNHGPVYWQMPSENNLWFAPMPQNWKPQKSGHQTQPAEAPGMIAFSALQSSGKRLSWTDLVEIITKQKKCSEKTAQRKIKDAIKAGLIANANGVYEIRSTDINGQCLLVSDNDKPCMDNRQTDTPI